MIPGEKKNNTTEGEMEEGGAANLPSRRAARRVELNAQKEKREPTLQGETSSHGIWTSRYIKNELKPQKIQQRNSRPPSPPPCPSIEMNSCKERRSAGDCKKKRSGEESQTRINHSGTNTTNAREKRFIDRSESSGKNQVGQKSK